MGLPWTVYLERKDDLQREANANDFPHLNETMGKVSSRHTSYMKTFTPVFIIVFHLSKSLKIYCGKAKNVFKSILRWRVYTPSWDFQS